MKSCADRYHRKRSNLSWLTSYPSTLCHKQCVTCFFYCLLQYPLPDQSAPTSAAPASLSSSSWRTSLKYAPSTYRNTQFSETPFRLLFALTSILLPSKEGRQIGLQISRTKLQGCIQSKHKHQSSKQKIALVNARSGIPDMLTCS